MNIYEVDPRCMGVSELDYVWHVYAPDWNRAKTLWISYIDMGIEWTDPISTKKLAKDLDHAEGVDDNYTWARATGYPILFPEDNPEWSYLYKDKRVNNFRKELAELINKHSLENGSDTPDFILAEYLAQCLEVFDSAVKHRDAWYGRENNFAAHLAPLTGE